MSAAVRFCCTVQCSHVCKRYRPACSAQHSHLTYLYSVEQHLLSTQDALAAWLGFTLLACPRFWPPSTWQTVTPRRYLPVYTPLVPLSVVQDSKCHHCCVCGCRYRNAVQRCGGLPVRGPQQQALVRNERVQLWVHFMHNSGVRSTALDDQ